jgi:hypothetical protein
VRTLIEVRTPTDRKSGNASVGAAGLLPERTRAGARRGP